MTRSVFISSTALDLRDHRAAVDAAIRRLEQRPINMQDFGSQPNGATEVSLREVGKADVFVGVLARRYGSLPSPRHDAWQLGWRRHPPALPPSLPRFGGSRPASRCRLCHLCRHSAPRSRLPADKLGGGFAKPRKLQPLDSAATSESPSPESEANAGEGLG